MAIVPFWGHTTKNPNKIGKECLSQWYHAPFTALEGTISFPTCEHFMMYNKAIYFGDFETGSKILQVATPKEAKALGRQVKNFDESEWQLVRERIVYYGNFYKFTQNKELLDFLLSFPKDTVFVEASPYDRIWGVGLKENDLRINYPEQWQGLNLLGKALSRVRRDIDCLSGE